LNQLLVASAKLALAAKIPGVPTRPGLCLAFVRVVAEHALKVPSHEFYTKFLVAGTTRRGGTPQQRLAEARADPWASDLEASAKQLGFAVPGLLRAGGDLVFNHLASEPVGHVGILLDRNWVVESVDPRYRPDSINLPGCLSLTPYGSRGWTLVARLREP
jgi:hypothetical protein